MNLLDATKGTALSHARGRADTVSTLAVLYAALLLICAPGLVSTSRAAVRGRSGPSRFGDDGLVLGFPGDLNFDNRVDVRDANLLVAAIFAGNRVPFADVNSDGAVGASDFPELAVLAGSPSPRTLGQLRTNRRKWEAAGINSYRFQYQLSCFCFLQVPHDVFLAVSNGRIASAVDALTGDPVPNPPDGAYRTIDDIFDLAEQAIAGGADVVTVTYDATLGYPVNLFINYKVAVQDDEIGIGDSDLQVVP